MNLGYPIIDLHCHLRNDIPGHTKIAKESGINLVLYMANSQPPLDSLKEIKKSLKKKRYCQAIPISSITKELAGKELVEVDKIKPYVAGFSDDGKYLKNLNLLKEVLKKNVLVLAHCSPPYEIGVKRPYLETKFVERYLKVLKKVSGKLHIQHVSQKGTVELIRKAKKQGLKITCETCPHYFTYTKDSLETKVNPPLATKEDIEAVKKGLKDGTIDAISSDYAPLPRITGMAGFRAFLPLSYGLVLAGVLSEKQLKEKLFINPKKIIESGGYYGKITSHY
jgi:dihydroorotase